MLFCAVSFDFTVHKEVESGRVAWEKTEPLHYLRILERAERLRNVEKSVKFLFQTISRNGGK